ncbi:MAG: phenylalanine--tRNA ligase alpha subunit [Candidatus Sumerlaea sp.]|jgi:phenylalanyl-tRNA synthetase alpha chain|uniref:Phenylalanine--tRNA ligase alpha subunit n=1 Tax=Sumerlaea chitinivorans TaxID=2250252 RepID=A0A2Z4Y559_SUMC1|nr:Phenylalanyl-tRNA synthetase alpha chain [Candidatus Sumerlaea chitinivorans]GIX44028.1 MAG: phenylalanine--tRNA ligase alpha subunit [Candidatus Sumerlaea sp.]
MAMEEIQQQVAAAKEAALTAIENASNVTQLEQLKPDVLGKKSPLRQLMRLLKDLSAEERPAAGALINEAVAEVEQRFESRLTLLRDQELERRLALEKVDVTLPPPHRCAGSLHPLTLTLNEIVRIFVSMGYEVATGPDIETEYHNFDALNILPDHPARDMHDTFFLAPGVILRTHTSPVQIRYMKSHRPPIAIIAPGRVYRVDDVDATHSPVFHQVEGLLVDKHVSFAHLKGTLTEFLHAMFGRDLATRFRPSYFPFTEPSAEVDVQCFICRGKSSECRICKGTGWIEVLGSGMVHPNVLENVGLNPREVSGFAFGLGVERFAMLRYGIPNIRCFYENDIRFLSQFRARV